MKQLNILDAEKKALTLKSPIELDEESKYSTIFADFDNEQFPINIEAALVFS